MYLILIDHNYISSEELQELIELYDADADIVHSSSGDTLLSIAEKILPEIIIIDFSMVKDEDTAYFEALSEISKDAYVLVLLDPEYYEKLNMVIEIGGIDGYIAKPIRREEFLARIQIANRWKLTDSEEPELVSQDNATMTNGEPSIEHVNEELAGDNDATEIYIPERFPITNLEKPSFEQAAGENVSSEDHKMKEETAEDQHDSEDLDDDISDGRIINDLTSGIKEEDFEALNISPEQEKIEPYNYKIAVEPEEVTTEKPLEQETAGSLFDDVIFEDQSEPVEEQNVLTDDQIINEKRSEMEKYISNDQYEKLQRDIDEAVVKPAMEFLDQGRDVTIQSSLPGNSADEFLYGDSQALEDTLEELSNAPQLDEYNKTENDFSLSRSRVRSRKTGSGGPLKLLKAFGNLLFILVLLLMAGVSIFLILNRTADPVPAVAGYQLYIIKSDDMNPELTGGSLAYGRKIAPDQISVGDVIAFRSQADPDYILASRVIGISREDRMMLTTRGDANTINEPGQLYAEDVIGTVSGSFPYIGSLLDFAKTSEGLILMIFVPGGLIIFLQLFKIIYYYSGKKKK